MVPNRATHHKFSFEGKLSRQIIGKSFSEFMIKDLKIRWKCPGSLTQSAFTCSKLTTETLEHGGKYVQS